MSKKLLKTFLIFYNLAMKINRTNNKSQEHPKNCKMQKNYSNNKFRSRLGNYNSKKQNKNNVLITVKFIIVLCE